MNTLFGMNVMTSALIKPVPVLQISPGFGFCTEAFRTEMNSWLLKTFGTKEVAYVIGGNTLVLNHAMLDKINRMILKADSVTLAELYVFLYNLHTLHSAREDK